MHFKSSARSSKSGLADSLAKRRVVSKAKRTIKRLITAIDKTEQSREQVHEAGLDCWIDNLFQRS